MRPLGFTYFGAVSADAVSGVPQQPEGSSKGRFVVCDEVDV